MIEDQIAKLYFNDAFIIQQAFTLFEGGNINIHQGEHTAGSGSDTEISKIIAYSN